MEDKEIIKLFWNRSENAIRETTKKYGKYCYYIAYKILYNVQDSEECVNDTYLKTWENIPPHKPDRLSVYLGKITRNLALNKWDYYYAAKRGKGQAVFILEELKECIPSSQTTEQIVDEIHFTDILNRYLASLSRQKRIIFVRRYWYMCSVKEISRDFELSESKIKMILLRLRKDFRDYLRNEGIDI